MVLIDILDQDKDLAFDETIFLWDKKKFSRVPDKFVDLEDIFRFYHADTLEKVAQITKAKISDLVQYKETTSTIKKISKTYRNIPGGFTKDCVPDFILEDLKAARCNILLHSIQWLKEKDFYPELINFYNNTSSIHITRKLKYKIKTSLGEDLVDLGFARNFRFRVLGKSLDMLHMPKSERYILIPQEEDHVLYSVDFSQFEFRTFLDIHPDLEIPDAEDLYEYYSKKADLSKGKLDIISYLYGKENEKLDELFNKQKLLKGTEFYQVQGYPVIIPDSEPEHKKIHTLVQTISQYRMLDKLDTLLDAVENTDVKFLYPLHDELIFSIKKSKLNELTTKIKSVIIDRTYKVKEYTGNNFGSMERI